LRLGALRLWCVGGVGHRSFLLSVLRPLRLLSDTSFFFGALLDSFPDGFPDARQTAHRSPSDLAASLTRQDAQDASDFTFKDRLLKSRPSCKSVYAVSAARLGLPQAKLSRKFNQVARRRIRRFESHMPSQAVWSLGGMCWLEKCFRHFRVAGAGSPGWSGGTALWFGIPYILLTLNTVSTDDAFVNGHVTFVAARVHGQVSRVLVDDNNRVHKGDLLVELDKEPFRDAVAVKKAAVDSAQADLQAAGCLVPECRGISHADPTFREAIWAKYFMVAPRPRTPSELRYSDRRLRSKTWPRDMD
jgi:hypothetical protein